MRLFAALGSGDIVAAHQAQKDGEPNITETSVIYSGQIAELCRQQNVALLAISKNKRKDVIVDECLRLENRPPLFVERSGLSFHFSELLYSFYLTIRAMTFRADLAVIDSGTVHYFSLVLFRLIGIPVAVNFHNTLWPNGYPPTRRTARLLLGLDAWFFRRIAVAAIGVSPECAIQLRSLTKSDIHFFEYRCQFRESGFHLPRQRAEGEPFRVLFASRAERSKGLLDLIDIARELQSRSKLRVVFEVCGEGGALQEFRQLVSEFDLTDTIQIHGRLARPELLKVYRKAHVLIVPTRSDFCEGMPHVCAEAVLSGLPVITSRLSNSIPVIGPAVAEAEPEDIKAYADAIVRLAYHPDIYRQMSEACPELSLQFLDRSRSYAAAMDRLLAHVYSSWHVLPNYEAIFERMTS